MKKLFRILFVLMLTLSLFTFVSCDDEGDEDPSDKDPNGFEDIFPGFGEGVEGPIIPYE